ncbi:MAG: hypothetical protein LIO71_00535 [Ruminococcus sp.]|nr:hypothetical protein [Ruminococcus sp.]MCD7799608.1 hypothetical protein [Ruminococcus sp.]
MLSMLCVVVSYTFCSYSDKYFISKAKMSSNTFTFFLSLSMLIFMGMYLPLDFYIYPTVETIVLLGLFTLCKILEFKLTAYTLTELSAFELKAWLGLGVFISYFYDVMFNGVSFSMISVTFIAMTVIGLFLITIDGSKKINYKKISLGLVGVVFAKSGYGIVIHRLKDTCSSTLAMCIAFFLICLGMLTFYNPIAEFKRQPKDIAKLSAVRIVNTIGSLIENYVAQMSVISYSLIQPLILILMFIINIVKHEKTSYKGIIGGIVCIIGIISLQLSRNS